VKITSKQLAEMEKAGARVVRRPGTRPKPEQPATPEVTAPTVAPEKPVVAQAPSAEGEALRMLVAQNSEVIRQLAESMGSKQSHDAWDAEIIRDSKVKGEYKPITHVRLRAVTG